MIMVMVMPKMRNRSGFTIIELIFVVIVIGILSGIMLVAYTGVRQEARDSERKYELEILASAIDKYYLSNGHYPMPSGWCTQISNTASGYDTAFASELAPYLDEVPYDPIHKGTYQGYLYRNVGDASYYLYAELEGEDRVDDGFSGCSRIGGINNEYDYRTPAF